MDMIKVGRFLAQLRTEHGLTQSQLGDAIGVTNKTISRWETGNYLPPVEMLSILSEKYDVSINEILVGERLGDTEFRQTADENIKECLKQSVFTLKERMAYYKRKWRKDHLMQFVCAAIIFAAAFALGAVYNGVLCIAASVAAALYSVIRYNKMMAYVEQRSFAPTQKNE